MEYFNNFMTMVILSRGNKLKSIDIESIHNFTYRFSSYVSEQKFRIHFSSKYVTISINIKYQQKAKFFNYTQIGKAYERSNGDYDRFKKCLLMWIKYK